MKRRKSDDDKILFWIVTIIFIGISLPFIGISFLRKPEEDKKILGGLMLAAGLLFWLFLIFAK